MCRSFRLATLLILLGWIGTFAQQNKPSFTVRTGDQPWVVSVTHEMDSDKMIARLRQQENVRVGVPGNSPQKLINITTGLVIDDKGHVITRLANLDPEDKDATIVVNANNGARLPAKLIGVDCPTGFAVLEVIGIKSPLPAFAPTSLLAQGLGVKIISADVSALSENNKQLYINYTIKQESGQVGPGNAYAKAKGALTLNSGNLLSKNDGSIVTTFDNQVAGIAQYAGVGRAYLFPFEYIRDTIVKRVLQKQDSIPAGWLGVKVDALTQLSEMEFSKLGLPRKLGVIVRQVVPDSPAAASGVKPNDVIVGMDEFDINNKTDLDRLLSSRPAGQNINLRAIRNHNKLGLGVVLGPRLYNGQTISYLESEASEQSFSAERDNLERHLDQLRTQYRENLKKTNSQERNEVLRELETEIRQVYDNIRQLSEQSRPSPSFVPNNYNAEVDLGLVFFAAGFAARNLDRNMEPQLAAFFGAAKGALVVSVAKGSAAEQSGLKAGDIIVGAYRQVMSCRQLSSILEKRRAQILLKVVRDKRRMAISLDNRIKQTQ